MGIVSLSMILQIFLNFGQFEFVILLNFILIKKVCKDIINVIEKNKDDKTSDIHMLLPSTL